LCSLQAFLDERTANRIYFFIHTGDDAWTGSAGLACATSLPVASIARSACLCLLKESPSKVSSIDPSSGIIMTDVRDGALGGLLSLAKHAVFPMLQLPQNRRGLNPNALKEFNYACEEFVGALDILAGKLQGRIVLPLPKGFDVSDPVAVARQRDSVRILECVVLAWTKQIRWSLSKEAGDGTSSGSEPRPSAELDFWSERARELHAILDQVGPPQGAPAAVHT